MTDKPRTPLTLEYEPEGLEDDPKSKPVIIVEPSFAHPGRIFVGVHPFGRRLGCHLLPEDAARIREHLGKLLMDESEGDLGAGVTDWQERIEAAALRARAPAKIRKRKLKMPKTAFRVEFQIGKVVCVLGTLNKQ